MTGLKRLARTLIPPPVLTYLVTVRARRHSHRLNAAWHIADLSRKLFDALGGTVQAGPFAGLKLPREAAAEHLGPYLLGTYEHELHAFWPTLDGGTVPLVVNVGSKFGYYAVGLARRLKTPVRAFEADPWARRMLSLTASLNSVEIDIHGRCDRSALSNLPKGALVVIDCDGCEVELLRAPLPHGLIRSLVIVELHGASADGDEIIALLGQTHTVAIVPSVEDAVPPADLPCLSAHERELAVKEIRTPQRWAICSPRG